MAVWYCGPPKSIGRARCWAWRRLVSAAPPSPRTASRTERRDHRAGAATAHFDSAEDLFTRLGARPFLEECRAERRACTPERGDTPDLDHLLTGREREVARLVGLGCTNREIADELTLSVKTIEYHLRSVFVKLGMRSRRELRRRVQEAGGGDGRR